MRIPRRRWSSERGSVVVMLAVSLFALLAMAALAIDMSNLRDAKADAQRAADVIALSGASDPRSVTSAARGVSRYRSLSGAWIARRSSAFIVVSPRGCGRNDALPPGSHVESAQQHGVVIDDNDRALCSATNCPALVH